MPKSYGCPCCGRQLESPSAMCGYCGSALVDLWGLDVPSVVSNSSWWSRFKKFLDSPELRPNLVENAAGEIADIITFASYQPFGFAMPTYVSGMIQYFASNFRTNNPGYILPMDFRQCEHDTDAAILDLRLNAKEIGNIMGLTSHEMEFAWRQAIKFSRQDKQYVITRIAYQIATYSYETSYSDGKVGNGYQNLTNITSWVNEYNCQQGWSVWPHRRSKELRLLPRQFDNIVMGIHLSQWELRLAWYEACHIAFNSRWHEGWHNFYHPGSSVWNNS